MSAADRETDEAGIPEWVVTFGDMMSLLLTFFIMLVSMSEIKEEKRFQAMVDSLRRRFGHESSSGSVIVPGMSPPNNSAFDRIATMGRSRRLDIMRGGAKVKAPTGENPLPPTMNLSGQNTVGGVIYFKEGQGLLSEEQKAKLLDIAKKIGGKRQRVEIRGHTSNRPLPEGSPFRSHWDLAYARCVETMDYLVKHGIDQKRIRLSVAGHNEMRHVGTDPLLWRENPRVEVFLLNEMTGDLSGTQEERKKRYSE